MTASPEPFVPPVPPARCAACGYVLSGLPTPGACPECGRGFDLDDPATFTVKTPFIGWRYWLPGLSLAAAVGICLSAVLALAGNWGASLWISVPFAAGCILGYGVRFRVYALALLCIALAGSLISGMVIMNLAGVYCGLVLSVILAAPILLGASAGATLRFWLKRGRFSQRSHLPILIFIAMPLASAAVEGPPAANPLETVATTHILEGGSGEAWEAIVFYENVTLEPPWLLKVGLARPLSTVGPGESVGDVRRCIYNKGHITKVIIESDKPNRLAFSVTEQQIGYERDVRLIGGAFSFRSLSADRTEVTLTTTYQPRLGPRFAWRPFEHYAVHLLHGYVLDGMAGRLDAETAPARTLTEGP